jgi:hypothetical protein
MAAVAATSACTCGPSPRSRLARTTARFTTSPVVIVTVDSTRRLCRGAMVVLQETTQTLSTGDAVVVD